MPSTPRVVLLGDSHLARVRRDLARIAPSVTNAAVGGATVRELMAQAMSAGVTSHDVLVVSVGSNDAAPWKSVPLAEFAALLDAFLATVPHAGLVLLSPPGVDEARLAGAGNRTNAVLDTYAEAACTRFAAAGAVVVDGRALLADLGPAAYDADGLHLTAAAYDVVLPALAAAVTTTAT